MMVLFDNYSHKIFHQKKINRKINITFKDTETPRMATLVSDLHIRLTLPDCPTAKLPWSFKEIYQAHSKSCVCFHTTEECYYQRQFIPPCKSSIPMIL